MEPFSATIESSRIDNLTVLTIIRHRRWQLLSLSIVGFGLAVLLAYALPVRYTATVRLLPELQASQAINLEPFRNLAESIGLDFDAKPQVEAIRPDLYPAVLTSTPFALSVLQQRVVLQTGQSLPLHELLARRPWYEPDWFSESGNDGSLPLPTARPVRLNTAQRELVETTIKLIRADLNAKTGVMSISAHMPDPEVAAQTVQFATDYLQTFVRQYRTEKARTDADFVRTQWQKARRLAYQREQQMLTNRDATRFLALPSAGLENRRLEEQYNSARALFADLERELARADIRVQAVTPVFKVLEPAQVPDRRSSPQRTWIVLAGTLSGFVVGLLYWLGRNAWRP